MNLERQEGTRKTLEPFELTWDDLSQMTGLEGYPQVPGGTPAEVLARHFSGDRLPDNWEMLQDGTGIRIIVDQSEPGQETPRVRHGNSRSPSRKTRFLVFERDGFTCQYCGRRPPEVELVADHRHPFSQGGKTSLENLVTACYDCNAGKADRILAEGSTR